MNGSRKKGCGASGQHPLPNDGAGLQSSSGIEAGPALTVTRLRELLEYDPLTGIFKCKTKTSRREIGDQAGTIGSGTEYVRVCVEGKLYRAHRLVWFYMTGAWPPDLIDHRNRMRNDNRWENLRLATVEENNQNVGIERSNSASGTLGVSWYSSRGLWRAAISVDKRMIHLGYFADKEKADAAYRDAKAKRHPFAVLAD